MKRKNRPLLLVIALLLSFAVSGIGFVALLEGYLRIKVWQKNRHVQRLSKEIFRYDKSTSGYRLIPNRRYRHVEREFSYVVNSNSRGLRDREYTTAIPAGKRRIIVFGDSFTFGAGVEDWECYPKVLERMLAGSGVEVINAGMSGNSLLQNILLMKEVLGLYETNYVMMAVHGGDVTESASAGRLVDKTKPDAEGSGSTITMPGTGRRLPLFVRMKDFIRYHFLSYGFVVDRIKKNAKIAALCAKIGLARFADVDVRLEEEYTDGGSLALLKSMVQDYSNCARSHGVVPILFFVPDKWHVAPSFLHRKEGTSLDMINGVLGKVCKRRGVVFLNACDGMRKYPNADKELYYDYDYHYNKKGGEIFGSSLYEQLVKSGCLK